MNNNSDITTNPAQTQEIGKKIASTFRGGERVLLYGDLGSGKTTLAQGIARGLGVEGRVTSPTFTIVKTYKVDNHPQITTLYHIDAYRLQNEEDALSIGIKDIFADQKGVVVCEWPERLIGILPSKSIIIECELIDETRRKIVRR